MCEVCAEGAGTLQSYLVVLTKRPTTLYEARNDATSFSIAYGHHIQTLDTRHEIPNSSFTISIYHSLAAPTSSFNRASTVSLNEQKPDHYQSRCSKAPRICQADVLMCSSRSRSGDGTRSNNVGGHKMRFQVLSTTLIGSLHYCWVWRLITV